MVSGLPPKSGDAFDMSSNLLKGQIFSGPSKVVPKALSGRGSDAVWLYVATLSGGGAERVYLRLANHYAQTGRVVRLVVNRAEGPLVPLVAPGVELVELGVGRALAAVPRLTWALMRERPAALISALTLSNLVAVSAVQLARVLGGARVRVLISERNELTRFTGQMPKLKRVLVRAAVRLLYPLADKISGNAQGVVEDLAARLGRNPASFPLLSNPAPESDQIEAARLAPVPHPWLAEAGPVALAMGRLVDQKDYPTMLRAVAQADPKLRLIILGEGPREAALRALVAELGLSARVDFAGFQMNRFDYLAHADLFLLSSRIEGFPNALIEAVAFGVPCVATDCAGGGPKQILGVAVPQALVPVGDHAAMAQAINAMRAEPPAPETLEAIAAQYRIEAISERFLQEVLP
ncbi:glycosyltransferase involved in cell wall biosynthesis [Rhodobacter aestuarii]|uniref:Glycosyltransferase involved in cell wall bisynthesis n=2 Tax=Rhodobacter aestuarii TaxID=453582 RepID=A0A1N7MTR5_9RHOB|nr:glycosyltransferase involved in cell wall biosynthesis [Rhodobacter aestuarii]SIS89249.1 Glycosyltransferase involved in cell wall bisynthesis [Rhodobacter aestuarii]